MKLFIGKKPQRHIPHPSGPYSVGCTDVMTSYSTSGVFARLFYPAAPIKDAQSPEWVPHRSYLEGFAMFFKMWPPLYCTFFPTFVGDIHIPASWNAPPLVNGRKFPVVIFSHGLGGCRTSYTTLCLELASHGYVVAALEHRDYSAGMTFFFEKNSPSSTEGNKTPTTDKSEKKGTASPPEEGLTKKWMLFRKVKQGKKEYSVRNEQVHQRAKECSTALDLLHSLNAGIDVLNVLDSSSPLRDFEGLLDVENASIAGHSFGGATVIAAMATDKRFKAGLGLDTWMLPLREETSIFHKVTQPMLFINMEKFQTKANLRVMKKMESTKAERRFITLKGTVHLNQSDVPFLCDRSMRRLFGANSHLDRFVAMDLTSRLSMVFLANHLALPRSIHHESYLHHHKNVMMEGIQLR